MNDLKLYLSNRIIDLKKDIETAKILNQEFRTKTQKKLLEELEYIFDRLKKF